jgi:hypothetical protein
MVSIISLHGGSNILATLINDRCLQWVGNALKSHLGTIEPEMSSSDRGCGLMQVMLALAVKV